MVFRQAEDVLIVALVHRQHIVVLIEVSCDKLSYTMIDGDSLRSDRRYGTRIGIIAA